MSKRAIALALLALLTSVTSVFANNPPSVGPVTAPNDAVLVNTTLDASAEFSDPESPDSHSALWDWGNGTITSGFVDESQGAGTATGSFTYFVPGVHRVTLTLTNAENLSGQAQYRYVVVYNPSAGGISGTGTVNSPAGSYTANPKLAGSFTISQVYARYGTDGTLGSRQNTFKFVYSLGGFTLTSSKMYWMAVSGNRIWLKGEGSTNTGVPCYYLVSAVDSTSKLVTDKVRVKIWRKADGAVLYDNQRDSTGSSDPDDALATQPALTGYSSIILIR